MCKEKNNLIGGRSRVTTYDRASCFLVSGFAEVFFQINLFNALFCFLMSSSLLPPSRRLCFTWRLSVCNLLAISRRHYWSDLSSVYKEELITFCKSSVSGSSYFLKHSSTLQDWLGSLANISEERTIGSWWKFSRGRISLYKKVPVEFWMSSGYGYRFRIRTQDFDRIRFGRGVRTPSAMFLMLSEESQICAYLNYLM